MTKYHYLFNKLNILVKVWISLCHCLLLEQRLTIFDHKAKNLIQ